METTLALLKISVMKLIITSPLISEPYDGLYKQVGAYNKEDNWYRDQRCALRHDRKA